MTDREKAIVMAYTGYCMLAGDKLKVFYEYVGELLGRPVYTHEFADSDIQKKATNDFYKLCKETTPEDIADLQKEADYWHKLSQSYAHTICEMSKAVVEHGKTQWIPCSERLPEENGQYLITVKYVHVDGYDDIYAEHGEWMDGKWDMFCFGHCGQVEKILAWMPLPQPWKGEKL